MIVLRVAAMENGAVAAFSDRHAARPAGEEVLLTNVGAR